MPDAGVGGVLCPPSSSVVCGVGEMAGAAGDSVLNGIARSFAEGFASLVKVSTTFWLDTGATAANGEDAASVVGALQADVAWLTAAMAVVSVLVCAGRLALTRRARPAAEAARTLVLVVVTGGVGVPAVLSLWRFGDLFSAWIVERSVDGDVGARLLTLVGGLTNGDLALGAGAVIVIAVLGILAAVAQILLMVFRTAMLVVLAGALPLFAAASGTGRTGMASFQRALAYLLAFLLYKPTAAIIYAGGFRLLGTSDDVTTVLAGIMLFVGSVFAMPALVKLLTPVVGGAGSGGGSGAGVVLATGAQMLARRTP